ncbi:Retrovirus Pol polyprotein from transposon [Paragonimus westermani]|uniref:Retrovirus Pol polyprotein from transposon n=1 Tax=Paragonimus westermani TaxID=34504 RepID=A0A8T0DYJ4_9TREM|nr:Retrovirus Pol polyprotein from transposon [Paragonimus westermani]
MHRTMSLPPIVNPFPKSTFFPHPGRQNYFLELNYHTYPRVPPVPGDITKEVKTTPSGIFYFLLAPFGLRNAAQGFQCSMAQVADDFDFVCLP